MWLPLLLAACAVVVVATLADTIRAVWRAARNNDEVLQRVEILGHEGRVEDALEVAHGLGGAAAAVVTAGLTRPDESDADRAIEEVAAAQRAPFELRARVLEWLAFVALIGPAAAAVERIAADARGFDGGALQALLGLAAAGLAIALAATLGRFWLLTRLRRLAVDMEKGAVVVYNTAR